MIIYRDTEKELTEYKPLPGSLKGLSIDSLTELIDNLEKAQACFWIYGNDWIAAGIGMDIQKAKLYLTMARKRAARQAIIDRIPDKAIQYMKTERKKVNRNGKKGNYIPV